MLSDTRVFSTRLLLCGWVLVLAVLVASCDTAEGPSLYDPIANGIYQPKGDPVLTAISPEPGQALAGVSELTLTGQNFNPHVDSTFVYFNGRRYPVLEITPTSIRMLAPNIPAPGIRVKVSVLRAENFSSTMPYELLPAVERLDALWLPRAWEPRSLTVDPATGDVYVSYLADGLAAGIRKISKGEGTLYSSVRNFYQSLSWLNDALYGAREVQAFFLIPPGETVRNDQAAVLSGSDLKDAALRIRASDVDDAGNVWLGGTGSSNFYAVSGKTVVTTGTLAGSRVLAIEARPDAVYLSATVGTQNAIYRFTRTGNTLGAPEMVLDITAAYPGRQATAIAFSQEGNMFVGLSLVVENVATPNQVPLLIVRPDGTQQEFYDGLLQGNARALEWLEGSILLAAGPLIVADASSNIASALGDLVKINTLQAAER